MREYDYVPRPKVEHHYHIKELIDAQERRASDRNYHRQKQKDRDEREKDIRDAQLFVLTDFWCHVCKTDFKSQTIKEVEQDWSCPSQRIAFYKTKCTKGHWCQRRITDKSSDGFLSRSKNIARDKGQHYADTIQPYQTNFNLLYGKQ